LSSLYSALPMSICWFSTVTVRSVGYMLSEK
jgi:hypothetical protein